LSFGGSGGSSGSAGTIRYSIVIDDSQINSKLSNIQQRLSSLDSASQSVGAGLTSLNIGIQSIGTNAQNAGSGLTTLSSDIQNLSSNTKSAKTDLDAINSNWQTMEQGAKNSATSVDALGNVFKDTQGGLNQYNTLAGEVVTNTNKMADATQTSGQKIKQFAGFLKDNALAVGITASSIVDLVSSYTQLQKTQLTADRANLMAERSQQRLLKAQDKVNKLVAQGKQGTTEYNRAVQDKALAEEDAGLKTERAALATQTANEAAARFIPQFIQDSVLLGSAIAQMASSVKDITPAMKGFGGVLRGLGPAMIAFTGPILVAVAGIYSLLGALRAAQKLNELVQQKTGGKALTMSPLEAFRKQLFGSPEEKKQAADFDKQLKGNIVTAKEYEDILKESFDPMSMLDDVTNKVNASLGKLNTTGKDTSNKIEDVGTAADTTTTKVEGLGKAFDDVLDIATKAGQEAKIFDVLGQAIKNAGDASNDIKDFTNSVIKLTGELGSATAAAQPFAETMKLATGTAATAQITNMVNETAKLAPKIAGSTIEILRLDNEMQTLADKRAPEMRDAQIQAAEESQKAWKSFADDFNKNDLDLAGIFKFDKKFDSDKIAKKMIDSLPNKLEKKIKLDLKMETKDQQTSDAVQKYLQRLLDANPAGGYTWDPDLKIEGKNADKNAQEYAKVIVNSIDKNTQDPDLKKLRDNLKAAIDKGASASEIRDILANAVQDAPPIPVYIVADPSTAKNIQAGIDKGGPYNIAIAPNFGNVSAEIEKGQDPGVVTDTSPVKNGKYKGIKIGTKKKVGNHEEVMTDHGWVTTKQFSDYELGSLDPYYSWYAHNEHGNDPKNSTQGSTGTNPFNLSQDRSGYANVGYFMDLSRGGINNKPGSNSAENEQFGVDRLLGGGGGGKPNMFAEVNQQFNQLQQDMAGTMNKIEQDFLTVFLEMTKASKLTITAINKTWNQLASNLAGTDNKIESDFLTVSLEMAKSSKLTIAAINKNWNKLQSNMAGTDNQIESDLLTVFLEMSKATKLTSANINKTWNGLASGMSKIHLAIAKSWSAMMNKNIENTAAAAKKIESILHKIPDEEVRINIVTTKTTQLKTTRLGKGGIISAAEGYVTNGPELLMVGDNPGGHETIAAIPNNNPTEAMRALNRRFGNGSGGSIVNQTIQLHISGNDIINERNLSKRIKLTVGENRDRFG